MKNLSLNFLLILSISLLTFQCTTDQQSPNSGAFITRLGNDTLAVESFTIGEDMAEATVILRTPQTSLTTYELTFNEAGGIASMLTEDYGTNSPDDSEAASQSGISTEGDSLKIVFTRRGELQERMAAADPATLPFIDMVHWPYELVLRKMKKEGLTSLDQPLLAGTRAQPFEFRIFGTDSFSIKHPSRGTMYGTVGENGELLSLDAGQTTRKLTVERVEEVDVNTILAHFVAMDQVGKGVGPLSGAAETTATVDGANFKVTHGQPSKRGRELFGGIVPWNQRWRTGANRATHFSTDKDLMVRDLEVKAGEYTLFTIPAPDGGTLIINKQTGQNGRSYDESQDLGRVPMTISTGNEEVERFTIDVVDTEAGGAIQLKWGKTIFEIPFRVKE
jgi:hypothetical protein